MKNIKEITKISIILLLLALTPLASAKIYKWTDDQGQMHYTQRPAPVGKDATDIERKIRIAADLPTASLEKTTEPKAGKYGNKAGPKATIKPKTAPKNKENMTKEPEDKQTQDSVEEYKKKLKDYCEKQTSNLEALNSDTPIAWQDDGKTKLLSNSERKSKIESIQTSIQENCKADKKEDD